jgi:hypothetical protein
MAPATGTVTGTVAAGTDCPTARAMHVLVHGILNTEH